MSSLEQLHITKQKWNSSQTKLTGIIAIAKAFIFRLYWFRLLSVYNCLEMSSTVT